MNEEVELNEEELIEEKNRIREEFENPTSGEDDDVKLPSEEKEEKTYASVFESVEDLRKGIDNLKPSLSNSILDGMSDAALEEYYIGLRKEFSSEKKEVEEEVEVKKEEEDTDKPENVSEAMWSGLEAEFNTNGTITDEQYNELNKMGIPDSVVDKYIDGLKGDQDTFTQNVYDIAGGQDEYETIKAWAESNYDQKQLDAIVTGTHSEMLLKMKGIKADYLENNSVGSSNRVRGNGSSKEAGYADQAEYIMDRTSKEYRSNPKFKAKVDRLFKASHFA